MPDLTPAAKSPKGQKNGASTAPAVGPRGIALMPPHYGIEFVDCVADGEGPLQLMPRLDRRRGGQEMAPILSREWSPSAPNPTGLPDHVKSGVESISGLDLSDVRVHYNSSKPDQLHAFAYTQGTEIHVAPGQERHLPHEAWHVVQQKQGRVQPRFQLKGEQINDDHGLEHEADVMGAKAFQMTRSEIRGVEFPVKPTGSHAYGVEYNQIDPTSEHLDPRDLISLGGKPLQLQITGNDAIQPMDSADATQYRAHESAPTTEGRRANELDQNFNLAGNGAFRRARGLGCVQRALGSKTTNTNDEAFKVEYKKVTEGAGTKEPKGPAFKITLKELGEKGEQGDVRGLRPEAREEPLAPKPHYEIGQFTVRKPNAKNGHWAMYFNVQRDGVKHAPKVIKVDLTEREYRVYYQEKTKPNPDFEGREEHYQIGKGSLTVDRLYRIIAEVAVAKGKYIGLGVYDCQIFVKEIINRLDANEVKVNYALEYSQGKLPNVLLPGALING